MINTRPISSYSTFTPAPPPGQQMRKPVGHDVFPGNPVDAPTTSGPKDRGPMRYNNVIDQFQVGDNFRYKAGRQGKGETYCNVFTNDVTKAMGAEIPHTFNDVTGEPGKGSYQHNANGMVSWLRKHGGAKGWKKVSAEDAQKHADKGKPAVAAWSNPSGPGHLAVIRPAPGQKFDPAKGPTIAQAGGSNFNKGSVADGFKGCPNKNEIEYWVHD